MIKTNRLLPILALCFILLMVLQPSVSAWTSERFVEDKQKISELETETKYGTYEIIDNKWWDVLKIWT